MSKDEAKFNPRQTKFIENVVSGMTYTDAYKDAYKCSLKNARDHAWRLVAEKGGIKAEIDRRFDRIHDENMGVLKAAALEAIQTLKAKADFSTPSVQLAAIRDILDRAGYKPTDKHELAHSGEQQLTVLIDYGQPDTSESE